LSDSDRLSEARLLLLKLKSRLVAGEIDEGTYTRQRALVVADLEPGERAALATPTPEPISPHAGIKAARPQGPSGGVRGGLRTSVPSLADLDLQPGTVLLDQWRLEKELGRGGFGAVFEAVELHLQEHQAVKVLDPAMVAKEELLARFRREVSLMRKLVHPRIVRVFDYREDSAQLVALISMELVTGGSVKQLLSAAKQWELEVPLPLALEILRQTLEALAEAHAQGVIHRDVTPGNVLLAGGTPRELLADPWRDPKVKLVDFGIAGLVERSELSQKSRVLGTAAYVAPEVLDPNVEVTPAADVYGAGAIGYELLTGKLPLGRFAEPVALREQIPREVNEQVLSLLEGHAGSRPSAAAAATHLEGIKLQVRTLEERNQVAQSQPQPPLVRSSWMLAIGGETHGPYSEELLGQYLLRGEISPSTPGWAPGAASWQPLGERPEFLAVRLELERREVGARLLEEGAEVQRWAEEGSLQRGTRPKDEARHNAGPSSRPSRRRLSARSVVVLLVLGLAGAAAIVWQGATLAPTAKSAGTTPGNAARWGRLAPAAQLLSLKSLGEVPFSVAIAGDGEVLAIGSYERIVLWSVSTGKQLRSVKANTVRYPGEGIDTLRFSADGRVLASMGNDGIRLWDVQTGRLLQVYSRMLGSTQGFVFDQKGDLLASGDAALSGLKIWDVATGGLNRSLPARLGPSNIESISFLNDDKLLAAVVGNSLRIWSTVDWTFQRGVDATATWPDPSGRGLLIRDERGSFGLVDARKPEEVSALSIRPGVERAALHPSLEVAALGYPDGAIELFSTKNQTPVGALKCGEGKAPVELAFSAKGNVLIALHNEFAGPGEDAKVCVWDAGHG